MSRESCPLVEREARPLSSARLRSIRQSRIRRAACRSRCPIALCAKHIVGVAPALLGIRRVQTTSATSLPTSVALTAQTWFRWTESCSPMSHSVLPVASARGPLPSSHQNCLNRAPLPILFALEPSPDHCMPTFSCRLLSMAAWHRTVLVRRTIDMWVTLSRFSLACDLTP